MNPLYKTTNSDYSPLWELNNKDNLQGTQIPTFKEINMSKDKEKTLTLQIKKKLYQDLKKEKDQQFYKEQKLKRELNQNTCQPKNFDLDLENYKIPEPELKIGTPLYMTSNMDYGRLKPDKLEVNNKWYPKSNKFSSKHKNTLYRNTGLNTVLDKNRVYDYVI